MVRETAAAAIDVQEDTNPTRLGEKRGGRLPRKNMTAVSWPRRDRKGLRLHRGAFSQGGSGTYGRVASVRTVPATPVAGILSHGPVRREIPNGEDKRRRRDSCRGNVHRLDAGTEARWSFL